MNIFDAARAEAAKMRRSREIVALQMKMPAIASHFGWDPAEEWVQGSIQSLPNWYMADSLLALEYAAWRRFDPDTYWEYATEGAIKISARYDHPHTPSPKQIASLITVGCTHALQVRSIAEIRIGSHETRLFTASGHLMYMFVACGRKMHAGSAFRAANAVQLVRDLIGEELTVEEVAQPDLSVYNDISFHREPDGSWATTVSEKAYSA